MKKLASKHEEKPTPAAEPEAERATPKKVLIKKGGDSIPVEVKDGAHYAQLISEHGEASIEVLS